MASSDMTSAPSLARGCTILSIACLFAMSGCSTDPLADLSPGVGPAISDADLFTLAKIGPTWSFYKRSSTPIQRSSHPHPETHALVRYNTRAATQLDAAGKVISGAFFPDSSIIVKELSNNGTLNTYTVMMKLRGSSSAGFDGWIWAEFDPSGQVKYSTRGRGGSCSTCHSSGIDYTRMNDSHP